MYLGIQLIRQTMKGLALSNVGLHDTEYHLPAFTCLSLQVTASYIVYHFGFLVFPTAEISKTTSEADKHLSPRAIES
jgi:hypothetical protein